MWLSVFMLSLMALTVFQGLGTFLVAFERQFGWTRTQMSGAFALARAEGAVLGPIEGWLIDRLGNRRMILIGYIIMGIGFLLFSQVNGLWQFYAVFMLITLGSGLGGWLAMISMVNNWFIRKRSLAIAAAMSGVHVGALMVWPLAFGIDNYGFRWTTFAIGVFMLVIIGPVAKAVRNRPEDMGLQPDGGYESGGTQGAGAGAESDDEPEFTARQALRTRAFWALTIVHVSSSISIVTLALHLAPKLVDMGFSLTSAAFIPIFYTLIALPSQFLGGVCRGPIPEADCHVYIPHVPGHVHPGDSVRGDADDGVPVRGAVRGRVRRTNTAADGDTGRVFRAEGVRHDNGAVAGAEQYTDDLRAAVRGVHVRPARVVFRSVLHVRGYGVHGGGADADGEEAGT